MSHKLCINSTTKVERRLMQFLFVSLHPTGINIRINTKLSFLIRKIQLKKKFLSRTKKYLIVVERIIFLIFVNKKRAKEIIVLKREFSNGRKF